MSLYGAMMIGVQGLDANSAALSVSSSNIANVNTVGYKASQSAFSTLLADTMGQGGQTAQGVVSTAQQDVTDQGLLQSQTNATDLGINGNGFFVVNTQSDGSGQTFYTREGDFSPDANGNLENASGYYLMGYPVGSDGTVGSGATLGPINIDDLSGKAAATTTMTLQANLQASTAADTAYTAGDMTSGKVTPDFSRTVNVYDSQGGTQPLDLSFIKTGANSWSYEVSYTGDSGNISGANPIATGTMTFNSDGTLANAGSSSTPTGDISLNIPWAAASGLTSQPITINMGTPGSSNGITQFDSASGLTNANVDGALYGGLTGVTVGTNGTVSANFSNGLSQDVAEIPLATFSNADGLASVSGTAYAQTDASGAATVNAADTAGAGTIDGKTLETSTVDLGTEFTNLITTQRAYSASARIVTTADQMLQQLEQIPST